MTDRDLVDNILSSPDEPDGPLTDETPPKESENAQQKVTLPPEASGNQLLDALGDNVSRRVLQACKQKPMTAEELADACDVSESTIYRRLETLSTLGLVERTQRVESPAKTCYETIVDGLSIHVDDTLRVEPGASDYVVDAMRTVLSSIDVKQLSFERETNTVDIRFELSKTLLDALVELYIRDTSSREQ